MNDEGYLSNRYELKYLVTPRQADQVREFARSYLRMDRHGEGRENCSYPVHSLYLDSHDMMLYHGTLCGECERFKLRVRYYDESPGSPVFFEIKHKVKRCVHKQRALVRRASACELLQGRIPRPSDLVAGGNADYTTLFEFSQHLRRLGASVRAHVGYLREAWIGRDSSAVRVTMDRQVCCEPQRQCVFRTGYGSHVQVFPSHHVVLELKFSGQYPVWMHHLVQRLQLVQSSAAKYAQGVTLLGRAVSPVLNPTRTEVA